MSITIHLPSDIEQYGPDLQFFIDMMVRKLHVNRHKGFVDGKTAEFLVDRLNSEILELKEALNGHSQFDVALECVDVSNQAFLLALACLYKTKDEFEKGQNNGFTRPKATSEASPVGHGAEVDSGAHDPKSECGRA